MKDNNKIYNENDTIKNETIKNKNKKNFIEKSKSKILFWCWQKY